MAVKWNRSLGKHCLRSDEVRILLQLVDLEPFTRLVIPAFEFVRLRNVFKLLLADEPILRRDREETAAIGQQDLYSQLDPKVLHELDIFVQLGKRNRLYMHHVADIEVSKSHCGHLAADSEVATASGQLLLEVLLVVLGIVLPQDHVAHLFAVRLCGGRTFGRIVLQHLLAELREVVDEARARERLELLQFRDLQCRSEIRIIDLGFALGVGIALELFRDGDVKIDHVLQVVDEQLEVELAEVGIQERLLVLHQLRVDRRVLEEAFDQQEEHAEFVHLLGRALVVVEDDDLGAELQDVLVLVVRQAEVAHQDGQRALHELGDRADLEHAG
jgi:hypothetical protein